MTWQLGSVLVLTVALAVGFGWYERSRPPARVLALVAALAALAAIGRVAFAAFPNVKPTTDIVLFSGYTLGGPAGFAVGALAALVSNVFLGQGPWTPWQMAAWGGVALAGAVVGRLMRGREPSRLLLALVCGFAGLAFGAVMDTYQWTLAAEHTLTSYIAISGTSLGFNIAHALGNVAFALLIGPAFIRSLARYRRRFEVSWRDTAPALATALAALFIGAGLGDAVVARAAAPPDVAPAVARGLRYLESAQNRDGGVGGATGQPSDPYFSGWASLGFAAAGRNPQDVVRARNSVVDYLRRHIRAVQATQDYERAILALRGAGVSPRSFSGRDLVSRLRRRQRRDGSFDHLTDRSAFGILALRAAGHGRQSAPVRAAARWLLRVRNRNGGWGNAPNAPSDVDNTAAVLNALAAAGRGHGPAGQAAVRYLLRSQLRDGGFPLNRGGSSNSQSTSYAAMGLEAAGHPPRGVKRNGRTPITFLKAMQAADGSFRYNRDSAQTPVWVTAQALIALEARSLPLRPAPRRRATTASAAAAAAAAPASAPAGAHKRARRTGHARRSRAARGLRADRLGASTAEIAPTGPTGASDVAGGADPTSVRAVRAPARMDPAPHDDSGSAAAALLAALGALAAWLGLRRLPALRRRGT